MAPPLRARLEAGQALIGPILQEIPASPDLVEFLAAAGFDYVVVDGEHAGVGIERCRELVRAVDAFGMATLVRVPAADPARVVAYLDNGVQGLVLAHCSDASDAEALVQAVKYPPRGARGAASGSRAPVLARALGIWWVSHDSPWSSGLGAPEKS